MPELPPEAVLVVMPVALTGPTLAWIPMLILSLPWYVMKDVEDGEKE
jgi:hypothetical protein